MSLGMALVWSLVLLALNAFFVAAEFAVVAAKRHRLEALAAQGSAPARAAVRNSRDLSLMLAGAQFGITVCTLGLGALAKPAMASLVSGLLGGVGIPDSVATVLGVITGIVVVVFLHMVVGEMAPKSWAISHAERSAVLLAWPFRAFTTLAKPILLALNGLANLALRLVKVQPVNELANVHGPVELRMLLDASRVGGSLAQEEHSILSGVLSLPEIPVYAETLPIVDAVTVPATATQPEIERISLTSGRSRLVVVRSGDLDAQDPDAQEVDPQLPEPIGLVHIRDVLRAAPGATAQDLAYAAVRLDEHTGLHDAIAQMQRERSQLAFVTRGDRVVGITALEDLLERVLGEFDDETDQPAR